MGAHTLFRWIRGIAISLLALTLVGHVASRGAPVTLQPVQNLGFDVLSDGRVVAPVRLGIDGEIFAQNVVVTNGSIRLSELRCRDPLAVAFGPDDFVSVALPNAGAAIAGTNGPPWPDPVVQFHLSITHFDASRWKALFPDGPVPFHFLVCSMPTAQVWHQRGWLNATPNADSFPLLQDVHVGTPEISSLWNRNWSYICPLGGHPIPVIGLWDASARLYVGYDFQGARASDQSDRYIATAYCWRSGNTQSFITLAFPYGGSRYGELVYPQGGEVLASRFELIVDTNLADTDDPNERFQARLFQRYPDALPEVPARNDLSWIPGRVRLTDFMGPINLDLWGAGGETTFYPAGTILLQGWTGHREMPIDTAVRRGDLASVGLARNRLNVLLTNYARQFTVAGDPCLYWEKPLSGAWLPSWGGAPVTTLHNSEGWYAARVLVELFRYDRNRGVTNAQYLTAIDGLFNWAKHFVWTRNEFADVPSSPFAIGSTLSTAFLLDYYFTFKDDSARQASAAQALDLADHLTWRYLQIWGMDSDRFDGNLESAFLIEPNSGRDWAGLACANEVAWNIDALTQVYVHTGDSRMRYYLRGILQRWPALYRPSYADSLANYGSDALTEGLGLFDGSGPGRGNRYNYGFTEPLPLNEPIGNSTLRVVAGARACIAFDKNGTAGDVADYRTGGDGSCSFRVASTAVTGFDLSFSYPNVDISKLPVHLTRGGQVSQLDSTRVNRPPQSPSSLYLHDIRDGDVLEIGTVGQAAPIISLPAPHTYGENDLTAHTRGPFTMLPLAGDYALPQSWTDLNSFAGLIAGERWAYGIPYRQRLHAVTNMISLSAPGPGVIILAYAPPQDRALIQAPALVLDDGSPLPLSGKPPLAWHAWPPIFTQAVLLDYARVPNGRSVQQVNPNGTLLMAATVFQGDLTVWNPLQAALSEAGDTFAAAEKQRLALVALKSSYAALPAGAIALLPPVTAGPASAFAGATALDKKWTVLTEQQLIQTQSLNAVRFPVALWLGGEHYVKTVTTVGDGKTAVTRFLAGGGTLVVLASEPFPFYYGDGPNDQSGPADPLLPALGLPIQINFEQPPPGLVIRQAAGQNALPSVPKEFAFPQGDQRLRSVDRAGVNPLNHYLPLLTVVDGQGQSYGDAAAYIEFRTGPAKGGKVLYIWSTLLSGPQGQAILGDAVSWILNSTLRNPRIESIRSSRSGSVLFQFEGLPSVHYLLQSRDNLSAGTWALLEDFSSAATNRDLSFADAATLASKFYRLVAQP